MLSSLRLAALQSAAPKSTASRPTLLLLLAVLPALLLPLRSASAQGSFTTTKPFLLTLDKTRHFTLTAVPVVYKPLQGSVISGFLTLSGTPDNRSLSLFSNVHLAFMPVLGGKPTVTDTVPFGTVAPVSANLYCIASLGKSQGGNTFSLYGGSLSAASSGTYSSGTSFFRPQDAHAEIGRRFVSAKSALPSLRK